MSLNPALEEARFCPRCGAPATVDFPRRIACETCGYQAYFNPKPVAAAIPFDAAGRIWLHRRGYEPGQGLWTFVGGFVDLGESIEEAARREAREEMDLELDLGPLVGVYSRPQDRVVLIVYRAKIIDGSIPKTSDEATEIAGFAPGDLPWHEMAFWSTEQALRDVLRTPG
jgi:ADP-ribose pyrophosphatase YjhB (NUDIX family)